MRGGDGAVLAFAALVLEEEADELATVLLFVGKEVGSAISWVTKSTIVVRRTNFFVL